jgi:hypothetical protein
MLKPKGRYKKSRWTPEALSLILFHPKCVRLEVMDADNYENKYYPKSMNEGDFQIVDIINLEPTLKCLEFEVWIESRFFPETEPFVEPTGELVFKYKSVEG